MFKFCVNDDKIGLLRTYGASNLIFHPLKLKRFCFLHCRMLDFQFSYCECSTHGLF